MLTRPLHVLKKLCEVFVILFHRLLTAIHFSAPESATAPTQQQSTGEAIPPDSDCNLSNASPTPHTTPTTLSTGDTHALGTTSPGSSNTTMAENTARQTTLSSSNTAAEAMKHTLNAPETSLTTQRASLRLSASAQLGLTLTVPTSSQGQYIINMR